MSNNITLFLRAFSNNISPKDANRTKLGDPSKSEVIKTLLKRQSQKPINSILSSKEYDLKDFTSSKPPPASPSSTLQLSEGDGAIFAPFQPEEYLVDFWNGGK